MTDFQDINNLNPTPTALITGADKVPFYNTSDAKAYAMTMDQLQTWVLAGGTIDPTFDDVSADTVTITGTTGNTLVVDTNTLVVDAANNSVGIGTASPGGRLHVTAPGVNSIFDSGAAADGRIELRYNGVRQGLIGFDSGIVNIRADLSSVLRLGAGNADRWSISTAGHFLAITDASFDIGASGANRPRDLFLSGTATMGGTLTVTAQNAANFTSGSAATRSYIGLGTSSVGVYVGVAGSSGGLIGGSAANDLEIAADSNAIRFSAGNSRASANMILNASGNLGLGVTPSAWSGTFAAFEAGRLGSAFFAFSNANTVLSSNATYNGSWRYAYSAAASYYQQNGGVHSWQIAPSGTAGNAITFTQAMTLDASGNLGIGTTSIPSGRRLAIAGGSVRVDSDQQVEWGGSTVGIYGNASTNTLTFFTNTTTRLQLKSTGQTRFTPLAADPSGAEAGDVYYNSGTNKLKVYNGTAWVDLH